MIAPNVPESFVDQCPNQPGTCKGKLMPRRTAEQERAAQQAALYTLARYYAVQLAREQLRAQGRKPQYIEKRELIAMAPAFMPEAMAKAKRCAESILGAQTTPSAAAQGKVIVR
jgi:hypothetical protein